MTSFFSNVTQAPPIAVFALSNACKEDPHPNKVNLSVGAYRTEEGQPWVLPVVRTVESQLACDDTLNKEYLPITGMPDLTKNAVNMLLGNGHKMITENRTAGVQSLGGTGALRVAMQFLKESGGMKYVFISKPTWPNHISIAKNVGLEVIEYRYWKADTRTVDFDGLIEDLSKAKPGSFVILHACAHNPTGMDPTKEQWHKIAAVVREKNIFPLFDIAYQGFASGDLDADAWAVRMFAGLNVEFFAAQSFSKNFGLYNERIGNLCISTHDPAITGKVMSQMQVLVRRLYSNPPNHGGRIVANVLGNPALYSEWKDNVRTMANRIKLMRQKLFEKLRQLGTPGNWNHIVDQIGMFSYTGLSETQVDYLRDHYHVYMMKDGRVSMCGVTSSNVEYVASAFHDAVCNVK